MLRHAVLCIFLVLQCTAIEWEELGDRIQDHHEKIEFPGEDRDNWFWDDHFWRYPHMMRKECPDGYGWEGDYDNGECIGCKAGQYSASWGPTDRCISCPPGFYQQELMSNECMKCPVWRPFSESASDNEWDCKTMKEIGNQESALIKDGGLASVDVEIEAMGDMTFLDDMLEQLCGYQAHDMHAHVRYDSEKDCSTLQVRFTMAEAAAFKAHLYAQDLKTMLILVNDWIATGHSYVNRIFSMLNLADSLYLLGLKMDPSKIHRQMRNLVVTRIDSKFEQNCNEKGMNDESKFLSSTFCKPDSDFDADSTERRYLSYSAQSEACMTLGGRDRLHHLIEYDWEVKDCGKEDANCMKSLMKCEYDHDTKVSWIVIHVTKKYALLEDNAFDSVILQDEYGVEWTFNAQFAGSDCPCGPPAIDTEEGDCGEKPELQMVFWSSGRCNVCPFGTTWFDGECESCTQFHFFSETYSSGNDYGKCIDSVTLDHSVMGDTGTELNYYYIERRPYDIPRDNRQRYKVEIEAKLDVCYGVQHIDEYGTFCSEKYDDLESLSFDDFTDFDLTKLSCLAMHRISDLYDANCEGRKFSWPHTDNFYWLDAACMVVKHIRLTEDSCPDNDISKCDEVDENIRVLTMPFTLQRGFSNDLDWGSILIPILERVEFMTKADFSTVTTAVMGAMKLLGVFDTSHLTGLEMTDYLRDLIIELPEHLEMSEATWEQLNKEEDVYCDNGALKMDCQSACVIPYNQCLQKAGDNHELRCSANECNDCAVTYFAVNDKGVEEEYACVDTCVALKYHSDNTVLTLITANSAVKGDKLFHFDCQEGYRLENDDVNLQDCLLEEPIGYGCNIKGEINNQPTCVVDKCEIFDDVPDNGFIKSFHARADRRCRFVELACEPGYKLIGSTHLYCDSEGDWTTDVPTCEPVECDGEDSTIENGMLVNHLVGAETSWYRCDVNNPSYDGEMDYFTSDTCGESIVCGKHENEHCPPMIDDGYKVREWQHMPKEGEVMEHRIWNAEYRCNPGYVIKDNTQFSSDKDKHGWSECIEDEANHLPSCMMMDDEDEVDDGEMKPCKMPKAIFNGELVQEFKDEDGLVTHGKYECDEGFMMIETMMKDHGFCRELDHTYELPYCVPSDEWYKIEFELIGGYSKMQDGGRVKARHIYSDGSKDDWYTACDDHFNSPAAGSICRMVGFEYGKMIDAPKKMRPIKDVPFGLTNFWCNNYDDVLPTSPHCHTDDYGESGAPLCMPDEQIAVSCFNVWWNVDVKFQMKSRRKHKMFCPVTVEKEGIKMKTKNMGLNASWGGLIKNEETGKYDYTEFKEGVHYEDRPFSRKKGFRAIFIANIDDYDCFYCNIHLGMNWLNPNSVDNHNCM